MATFAKDDLPENFRRSGAHEGHSLHHVVWRTLGLTYLWAIFEMALPIGWVWIEVFYFQDQFMNNPNVSIWLRRLHEYIIVGVTQWFSHYCFGETYGYKRTARYLVPTSLFWVPLTCVLIAVLDPRDSKFTLAIYIVQIGYLSTCSILTGLVFIRQWTAVFWIAVPLVWYMGSLIFYDYVLMPWVLGGDFVERVMMVVFINPFLSIFTGIFNSWLNAKIHPHPHQFERPETPTEFGGCSHKEKGRKGIIGFLVRLFRMEDVPLGGALNHSRWVVVTLTTIVTSFFSKLILLSIPGWHFVWLAIIHTIISVIRRGSMGHRMDLVRAVGWFFKELFCCFPTLRNRRKVHPSPSKPTIVQPIAVRPSDQSSPEVQAMLSAIMAQAPSWQKPVIPETPTSGPPDPLEISHDISHQTSFEIDQADVRNVSAMLGIGGGPHSQPSTPTGGANTSASFHPPQPSTPTGVNASAAFRAPPARIHAAAPANTELHLAGEEMARAAAPGAVYADKQSSGLSSGSTSSLERANIPPIAAAPDLAPAILLTGAAGTPEPVPLAGATSELDGIAPSASHISVDQLNSSKFIFESAEAARKALEPVEGAPMNEAEAAKKMKPCASRYMQRYMSGPLLGEVGTPDGAWTPACGQADMVLAEACHEHTGMFVTLMIKLVMNLYFNPDHVPLNDLGIAFFFQLVIVFISELSLFYFEVGVKNYPFLARWRFRKPRFLMALIWLYLWVTVYYTKRFFTVFRNSHGY